MWDHVVCGFAGPLGRDGFEGMYCLPNLFDPISFQSIIMRRQYGVPSQER